MKTHRVLTSAVAAFVSVLLLYSCGGCDANTRAKSMGGTMEIELPEGKKLVNMTWKEGELWYLTRDMRLGETAEKHEFTEKSPLGILEGKVIVIEKGLPPEHAAKDARSD